MKYELIFTQQAASRGETINTDWIILDSFSTISLAGNQSLLKSVNACNPENKLFSPQTVYI